MKQHHYLENEMSDPRFLQVKFGDNDFGFPMEAALARLWGWVHKNNGHLVRVVPRSIPQMFVELHKSGVLTTLVDRLFVLETLCSDIENATRGLYWETVDWDTKTIIGSLNAKQYESYLSCDLSFHADKSFASEWQNGEHAWLDLNNGEVETF